MNFEKWSFVLLLCFTATWLHTDYNSLLETPYEIELFFLHKRPKILHRNFT